MAQIINLSNSSISQLPPGAGSAPCSCKFVHIESGDGDAIVFGLVRDFSYHAQLIERFCRDRSIAGDWVKKRELYTVYDQSVKIAGGGWLSYDHEQRSIVLYGRSTAYGAVDYERTLMIFRTHPEFAGFSIKVEQR